ncbi:hypothetical protein FRC06_010719, partial [Ceratobasidium sp. 370]
MPDDEQHHMCLPQKLQTDVMCAPFLDITTKVHRGGPHSLRLVIILVLRVLNTLFNERPSDIPPLPPYALTEAPFLLYMGSTIKQVNQQLHASTDILRSTHEDRRIANLKNMEYQSLGDVAISRQAARLAVAHTPEASSSRLPFLTLPRLQSKSHSSMSRSKSQTPSVSLERPQDRGITGPKVSFEQIPRGHTTHNPKNKRSADELASRMTLVEYQSSDIASSQPQQEDLPPSPPAEPSTKQLKTTPVQGTIPLVQTTDLPPAERCRPQPKPVTPSIGEAEPYEPGTVRSAKSPFPLPQNTSTPAQVPKCSKHSPEMIDIDATLAGEEIESNNEEEPPVVQKGKRKKRKSAKRQGKAAASGAARGRTPRPVSRGPSTRASSRAPSVPDEEVVNIEDDSSVNQNDSSFQVPTRQNNLLNSLGLQPTTLASTSADSAGLGLRSVRSGAAAGQA